MAPHSIPGHRQRDAQAYLCKDGLFCFNQEVMNEHIYIGYILCKLARMIRSTRLYNASRHSFRSGRPELFLAYWRNL